jgi:hypothetical protein
MPPSEVSLMTLLSFFTLVNHELLDELQQLQFEDVTVDWTDVSQELEDCCRALDFVGEILECVA